MHSSRRAAGGAPVARRQGERAAQLGVCAVMPKEHAPQELGLPVHHAQHPPAVG
jgi:hypothetical protein